MTKPYYLVDGLQIPNDESAGPGGPFWSALRDHRLVAQQCQACGTVQNPAEYLCHACYATEFDWPDLPTTGRVFSWTRIWHAVHDSLGDHVPYLLVWAEIDVPARPRFLGNLLGDPMQDVEIGAEVDGVFEDHPAGTLLHWRQRG